MSMTTELAQIKCDIEARKAMPGFGPDTSIERLRIINATQKSFSLETVEALVEVLEAAERQNVYLREQSDEWERKAISNFEDCSEMSKRIEELESQRQMAFMAGNRWADKFREAEKRIAELECITGALREIRPGHITIAGEKIGIYMRDEVDAALAAAGVAMEGE